MDRAQPLPISSSYSPRHTKGQKWYHPRKLLGKAAAELVNAVTHFAPLNATSRLFGKVVTSEYLPPFIHHFIIRGLVWLYGIPIEEYNPASVEEYRTTQDFFVRHVRPECRPISNAYVVSPCDAELLQVGEVGKYSTVVEQVHVKGFTYDLHNFLRVPLPTLKDGEKRIYMVMHLRPGDYHRFHCPVDNWTVHTSVHLPGALLPVTSAAMKWVPRLLVSNERVILQGNHCTMAAVGATNVGSVKLPWEEKIETNVSRRKRVKHAVYRKYAKGPTFQRGDAVGFFEFGSCIVLVMDVPQDVVCVVKPFQDVQMGEALFVRPGDHSDDGILDDDTTSSFGDDVAEDEE
eukprot:PhF_6_TR26434/c0_g1_i1/m.38264/K01613/psd, PISD; phosphatidylserine decarboxylase